MLSFLKFLVVKLKNKMPNKFPLRNLYGAWRVSTVAEVLALQVKQMNRWKPPSRHLFSSFSISQGVQGTKEKGRSN